jgi:hypothetical protein
MDFINGGLAVLVFYLNAIPADFNPALGFVSAAENP